MGKEDKKTKRGKVSLGTQGVRRPKKSTTASPEKKGNKEKSKK